MTYIYNQKLLWLRQSSSLVWLYSIIPRTDRWNDIDKWASNRSHFIYQNISFRYLNSKNQVKKKKKKKKKNQALKWSTSKSDSLNFYQWLFVLLLFCCVCLLVSIYIPWYHYVLKDFLLRLTSLTLWSSGITILDNLLSGNVKRLTEICRQ